MTSKGSCNNKIGRSRYIYILDKITLYKAREGVRGRSGSAHALPKFWPAKVSKHFLRGFLKIIRFVHCHSQNPNVLPG